MEIPTYMIIFILSISYSLANAELRLKYRGGIEQGDVVSIDNCSDSNLVFLTSDGNLVKAKNRESNYSLIEKRINGSGSPTIPDKIYGKAILCPDTNTVFIRSTNMVCRIHNGTMDTVSTDCCDIINSMITDDSGNVMFENSNWIYKVGKEGPAKKIVNILPGHYSAFYGFAAQDENNIVATMGDSGLFYIKNGLEKRIRLADIPNASELFTLVRNKDKYLIVDGDGRPFMFDITSETIAPVPNKSYFSYGNGNGFPISSNVYKGIQLFCSSLKIQSLVSGRIVDEDFIDDADSLVLDPSFLFSISSSHNSRVYIAGSGARIYEIKDISESTLGLNKIRQSYIDLYFYNNWGSKYLINGQKLPR